MQKLLKYVPGFLFLMYVIGTLLVIAVPVVVIIYGAYAINAHWMWPLWGVCLSMGIGIFYNDIYEEIRNRTNEIYIFPGKIKYLFNTSMLIFLIATIVVTNWMSYKRSGLIERYSNQLYNYEQYYNSTEELLDSLNIDADAPILETDVGAKYLEAKSVIDESK